MILLSACLTLLGQHIQAADDSTYETATFSFTIPAPWHYAIPEGRGKTVATCYLRSKLRLTAKGRFIVDTGSAAVATEKIAEVFASRMVPKQSTSKVHKTTVKLDGVDAILLKSATKVLTCVSSTASSILRACDAAA